MDETRVSFLSSAVEALSTLQPRDLAWHSSGTAKSRHYRNILVWQAKSDDEPDEQST